MRYSQIRSMDISNGENVGVSIFAQGCPFHCDNCFNPETWNFNNGKEWTEETKKQFLKLIDRPYIKRVSFLGGECLAEQNLNGIYDIILSVKRLFPDKKIWMHTGYTFDEIFYPIITDNIDIERDKMINLRKEIVKLVDVLIDGIFIDELKDPKLKWRGSSNQRVINIKETLKQNKLVLYCD